MASAICAVPVITAEAVSKWFAKIAPSAIKTLFDFFWTLKPPARADPAPPAARVSLKRARRTVARPASGSRQLEARPPHRGPGQQADRGQKARIVEISAGLNYRRCDNRNTARCVNQPGFNGQRGGTLACRA